eukprot:1311945-Karenia_brevis.AAC.1
MKIYRALFRSLYGSDGDDHAFLVKFGLVPPLGIVALSRLMLFKRIVVRKDLELFTCIHAARPRAKAWINALEQDLRFIATSSHFKPSKTWSMARW